MLNEIYTGWRWPRVVHKVEHRPLDYAKVWRETNVALDELGVSGDARAAILGDNAARIYSVEGAR